MRTVHWLFLVSVALFVSGIGFIIASARSGPGAAAPEAPATTPVASLAQIMSGIVQPNANVVYGAVGTKVSAAGVEEWAPETDEEWATVGSSAAALVEAGNLMLLGTRAVDRGDWVTMTREYMEEAQKAMAAVDAKSTEGILDAGAYINDTCDKCHERYWRQ